MAGGYCPDETLARETGSVKAFDPPWTYREAGVAAASTFS
jgi:hypothetical protein